MKEETDKKTIAKVVISKKILEGMMKQKIGRKELALKMLKQPSVITKWLSGTHNFTIETLNDLEQILNIKLLDINYKKMTQKQLKIVLLVNCIITISLLLMYSGELPVKIDLWILVALPITIFCLIYQLILWCVFLSNIDEYDK